MNKQDIITRLSLEMYVIECEDARAAAPFTGQGDAPQVYGSDTPHQIDTWIWDSETALTEPEKVQLVFAIYRDMPCYALLMLYGVRYERFAEETKTIFWEEVRSFLAHGDDAVAQPLLYMLWCDFFELCDVCDAWHIVMTDNTNAQVLRRILTISGPVPFALKDALYFKLLNDVSWHPAIYQSLRDSYYDLYGQIDKHRATQLLDRLVLIPEGTTDQQFRHALTTGERYSNWHSDLRKQRPTRKR